ncbi:MAG: gamma-glutamyl-phosphate reductase, partial [Muribaculaceae bacterium]|nr:gamma-glutamyl-phosphate reductase [Muribaculaceae bacterium]
MNDNLKTMLEGARRSSRMLNRLTDADINRVLLKAADAAVAATDSILAANAADLARMSKEDPKYDRLMLTADRIASIANDMRS